MQSQHQERRYHRDATTGRIVLTDLEKGDYAALAPDLKKEVKAYYRFSRDRGAWISKGATYMAESIARRLGLVDGGTEDAEPLSFAEQQQAKQDRAAARATRREGYAEAAQKNADRLYESGMDALRQIPLGQPMMPDHHSYKADRAYRGRAVSKVERSFEEADRARHHATQAAIAAHTADAPQLRDPAFLARRIAACETEIRALDRRSATTTDADYLARVAVVRAKQEEKLAYYRDLLDDVGGAAFTAASLKGARFVRTKRHGWVEVASVGPKNVRVCSHGCSWKVLIGEVLAAHFDTETLP